MEEKYTWNLKDIFEKEEDFYSTQNTIFEKLNEIQKYRGNLNESAENIYNCYKIYEEIVELYERCYSYGMLSYHLDMSNDKNKKLYKTVENIGTEFEKKTSFMVPEITRIENERLLEFLRNNSNLERYRRELEEIMKNKKHILSEKEEELLANYSEVFSNAENTFDVLTNTEFKYGKLKDANGNEVEMTDGTYTTFLKDKNRRVRKDAFDLMYNKYSEFLNTIGELYLCRVKQDTITSKLRNYESSLEKAVDNDDSSIKVYNALIEAVHENIDVNHKFMKIKKNLLGLEDMHLYDIYVNPIEVEEDNISFEEAKGQVLEALSVLGAEYISKLEEAFDNRWIDVFEKENKMGGAYSMGVYGIHPYVLLNFVNKKRDVSTIAHELGHSMHSYYSNTNQNVLDSNYTIMVAEIASTVNEILLAKYQIEKETNMQKRNELIYELLEMFRATFYRQAMFAEFEKIIHTKIEAGEMVTTDDMNEIYYNLNTKYFGNEVIVDEKIKFEWARIPHFYSPFYVYKYATGVSAAVAIAKNILDGKPGYVEKYINMLKQGCTKKAVELLKTVDVDLEDVNTYKNAISWMEDLSLNLEKN